MHSKTSREFSSRRLSSVMPNRGGGDESGDPWNGAARRPDRHCHRAGRGRRSGWRGLGAGAGGGRRDPNLAARLQALAQPGQIVLAGVTRRLIADLFRLRDLGRQTAKGFAEPVEAFVVEGFAVTESRFEAARRGLTDLVGRAAESALLRDRLREAWAGAGQIVLLSGEAGIGKSRLGAQLAAEVVNEPHTRLRYQCSCRHSCAVFRQHPVPRSAPSATA